MRQPNRDLNLVRQGLIKSSDHDVEQIDRVARRGRVSGIGGQLCEAQIAPVSRANYLLCRAHVVVEILPPSPIGNELA
jgi:hypothetical protein